MLGAKYVPGQAFVYGQLWTVLHFFTSSVTDLALIVEIYTLFGVDIAVMAKQRFRPECCSTGRYCHLSEQ